MDKNASLLTTFTQWESLKKKPAESIRDLLQRFAEMGEKLEARDIPLNDTIKAFYLMTKMGLADAETRIVISSACAGNTKLSYNGVLAAIKAINGSDKAQAKQTFEVYDETDEWGDGWNDARYGAEDAVYQVDELGGGEVQDGCGNVHWVDEDSNDVYVNVAGLGKPRRWKQMHKNFNPPSGK